MLTYCDPCPGNRNATGQPARETTEAAKDLTCRSFSVAAASALISATTKERWLKDARPTWRVCATSGRLTESFATKYAPRLSAAASRAVAVFADNNINCQGRHVEMESSDGASSRMTCALVPPMPNELTPARRGPFSLFHSASFVFT